MRFISRKLLARGAVVFAAAAGLWLGCRMLPPIGAFEGANPFRSPDGRPFVIAHAGGAGLNPENTLEAFEASVALGCDMLEMDVRLTRDGMLVTHHDAAVDRTSNGTGLVAEKTVAELKSLNFGYQFAAGDGSYPYQGRPARVATLKEVFEKYGHIPMIIDLKDRGPLGPEAAASLAAMISKHKMQDRVLVASFDDATLRTFRRLAGPQVATSAAKDETRTFVILRLLRLENLWRGGVHAFQVPADPSDAAGFDLANSGFIGSARARNMAVHYWTVNDTNQMQKLIALGPDGLITDFPDRLKGVIVRFRNPAGAHVRR